MQPILKHAIKLQVLPTNNAIMIKTESIISKEYRIWSYFTVQQNYIIKEAILGASHTEIRSWNLVSHSCVSALHTVYPKKYAHGFVVLCFVVVMQSFMMNSHEVFIHIHQGCFAGTGAIVRLPQCQWSKPDGYGKISQCITTTKQSKAKTVCIFLGIYCMSDFFNEKHSDKLQNAPVYRSNVLRMQQGKI